MAAGAELRRPGQLRRLRLQARGSGRGPGHARRGDAPPGGAPCLVRPPDLEQVWGAGGPPRAAEVPYLRGASQWGYVPTADGGYARKALPPIELDYEPLHWHTTIATVDRESIANLP